MALGPKPAQPIRYCKLKRVYPRLPLRVHSTVAKGLTGKGSGDPFRSEAPAPDALRDCESGPDRLRIRHENELSSQPWGRLQSVARGRRGGEDFLLGALGKAS